MKAGAPGNRPHMTAWEEKFVRFIAERWVFQGTDPHDFTPRTFIVAFGEDFLSPLLERHKHFGALYTGILGGRQIGYIKVPPGTVILEGIMRALQFTRVNTVIGLGTCGALQEEIDCGDVIVADAAMAGDCLSLHYGFEYNQVIPADMELSDSLAGFLGRGNPSVHKGHIVSTGSVLRETEELIDSWNRGGFLGVELEASALFALADWMKLRSTMALLVTDSPVRQETSEVLRGDKRQNFVQGIIDYIASPEVTA